MEDLKNVRVITQKEAEQIDANNVDYFTLTDGTIVRIKKEGEGEKVGGVQYGGEQQVLTQYNQSSEEEILNQQSQNQISEQNKEIQTSLETNSLNQIQNQEVILQPGENYGYYISNKPRNSSQYQQKQIYSYNSPLNQGYLNYNAILVDAKVAQDHSLDNLEFRDLSQSGPQTFQPGLVKKRQLYKLVEAVPITLTNYAESKYSSRNINSQRNFKNYNNRTFMTGKRKYQNMRKNFGMNYYNTQFYPSKYGYGYNSRKNRYRKWAHYNKQYAQNRNNAYNYGQLYQEQAYQSPEYQEGEDFQNQNNEFYECELQYSTDSQIQGNDQNSQCTCPIGNKEVRKEYELVDTEYAEE